MLNHTKVLSGIRQVAAKLFPDVSHIIKVAKKQLTVVTNDSLFDSKVVAAKSSFLLPGWDGAFNQVFPVTTLERRSAVLAVDGSQVYPDRHISGAGCFLLNVGGVSICYAKESTVRFFSCPHILTPEDLLDSDDGEEFFYELVDFKREELEFEFALKKGMELLKNSDLKKEELVCFIDGSLVFWYLQGKSCEVKMRFLNKYLYYLDQFYHHRIPIIGYISFPKSKELVNLLKLSLCRFSIADCITCHSRYSQFPCKQIDRLIDTHVVSLFLPRFHRTTIFHSNSKIVAHYPDRLKPCFFYIDVGKEVVRIELPAWLAQSKERVDFVSGVIIDQSSKGDGYPVCLAEAHEQAVVKGSDRDFFFHLVCKVGLEYKRRLLFSQKSIKKRRMNI